MSNKNHDFDPENYLDRIILLAADERYIFNQLDAMSAIELESPKTERLLQILNLNQAKQRILTKFAANHIIHEFNLSCK